MNATRCASSALTETSREDAGTNSHSQRVAAWCEELGRSLRLVPHELRALCEAGLAHHRPELLTDASLLRLMGDLGVAALDTVAEAPPPKALAEVILSAFHGKRANCPARALELAQVLEYANCVDEHLEFAPYAQERKHMGSHESDEMLVTAIAHLRMCSPADLLAALPKLPVYPSVAMQMFRMLQTDIDLAAVEDIARTDQVLAGKLVRAANSPCYGPSRPIRSVSQAIAYVGTVEARRILLASSVQPIYASSRMRNLWRHSLEAAQVAEKIAEVSGRAEPTEAFLVGLLHDVGKLSMSLMSEQVNDAIVRLLEKGCQLAAAETVLCGFDHAYAGGETLRHWRFEREFVAAVEDHHQPERTDSVLASILYLVEFWIDSEEDLPSNARLNAALGRAGLTVESLDDALGSFHAIPMEV